ncbi:hypothetical protein C0995_002807, partial [Termitomyces sp. Mi166
SAFMRVLRSIHAADVRHNDIRAENLAFTDDDRVAIIDFDRAQLDPSPGAKRREMGHLEYALNGVYPSWYEIPSPQSTPGRSKHMIWLLDVSVTRKNRIQSFEVVIETYGVLHSAYFEPRSALHLPEAPFAPFALRPAEAEAVGDMPSVAIVIFPEDRTSERQAILHQTAVLRQHPATA